MMSNSVATKISAIGKWVRPPWARSQKSEFMGHAKSLSILTERAVDDGEGMISFQVIDVGDSKNRAESSGFHNHRSRFGRGARRGLRKRGRHRGVKRDVAFHFLYNLM